MNWKKKILIAVVLILVAIQLVQPAHNKSETIADTDITKMYPVPQNVQSVLKKSCYDCHSNNTVYPWYFNVQPFGWLLAKHIKEGKLNLNFSEFGTYSIRKQTNKLRAIESSIKEGSMPISSYTLIHTNAKLSVNDTSIINTWVRKTRDSLSIKN